MGLIILSFFFSFSFFLKNEPGAVGTPGMGPPRHGSPGMSFQEKFQKESGEGPHESKGFPEVSQQAMLPISPPEVHPAAPVLQQEPQ